MLLLLLLLLMLQEEMLLLTLSACWRPPGWRGTQLPLLDSGGGPHAMSGQRPRRLLTAMQRRALLGSSGRGWSRCGACVRQSMLQWQQQRWAFRRLQQWRWRLMVATTAAQVLQQQLCLTWRPGRHTLLTGA